ncbi:MAG: hypothetical protein U0175_34480 [Caldilineaceae bacterium]
MRETVTFQRWKWRVPMMAGVLVLLLSSIIAGGVLIGYAQSQTCRDINNITVCGDTFSESTSNGGGFRLRGNLKIGPKGSAPVLFVRNSGSILDGTVLNESITAPTYFHFANSDPNTGTTDFLVGEVGFINDATGLGMFSTFAFDHPPAGGEVTAGRLFVDTVNRRVYLPGATDVPIFTARGVKRNQAYTLGFISQAGALSFFKNGGSVDELSLVDGEFDITNKLFKATLPVDLKLTESAENPNLRLTMRFQWTENRTFTGSIDGFKGRLGGLLMDVSGVKFNPGSASGVTPVVPASFEAAQVKVLKVDNPDVPTLDPTDPNLIFSFTKLKYKEGKFEIGGVEVPVNNWEFGNAFKMTNQTLGIISENNIQSIQIKSTLNFFGDDGDSKRKVPIILKIGRTEASPGVFKPVFAAGLQNISPKIGNFTFNLQGAVFSGNSVENFWGIKATTAALQWPAHLGGQTAAGINNFRLGVKLDANKNKKFDVGLGGGSFSLPPFETQVFTGTLAATLGVVSDTMVITGTGNFGFKLPGNSNSAGIQTTAIMRYGKGVAAPTTPVPPTGNTTVCKTPLGFFIPCVGGVVAAETNAETPKEFELKLSGFTVKIAGFGMTITNPKGTEDGGFAADNVAATLPAGLVFENIGSGTDTNGITIQGLVVPGTGTIQVAGGGFELAPIKFGGYQFVGLKGNFVQLPEGGFEFKAGGKLPLPGIEPGANGGGIGAEVRIRIKPDNSVNGFGVTVSFTAGGAIPKIKMPGTGMSLVKMTGGFDIVAGTSTIFVTVTAASDVGIPLGSLGTLPIATAEGGLNVQVTPNFKMSANAKLSILIFQVATASINIGHGFGFNGGDGMDVSFVVNTLFIDGSAHLKVGQVTLSDGTKKIRVQGDATVSVVIPEKIFAGLPRDPKTLASVTVGFGQYKDTKNNNRQSAGLLAMGSLAIVGTVGGFLDMGAQPVDVIFFTDPNRFQAVPGALLRQWAREGRLGYGSRILAADEVVALGIADAVSAASIGEIYQDTINHNLVSPTRLLMGIEYTGTLPVGGAIRLKLPNGTILTKSMANTDLQGYTEEKDAQGGVLMFALQEAVAGNYQLLIDNPPADYSANILELDQMPKGSITADTCGGGNTAGVTVVCSAGVNASEADIAEANQVSVNWSASDIDTPNATVDVGFVKVISGVVDNTTFTALEENKPLGTGSFVWNLSEVPTGEYRVMIEVSNDSGPAVRAYGSKLIKVTDKRAPAVPANFTIAALANELSVRWTQNSERDLAGYEIGLGVVSNQADSVNNFFYQRNMGPKETITGTNNLVDAKLWGIPDGTEVFFGIRAYDYSGNYSDWSPLLRGKPWALSPNTWTPLPNGKGSGMIEVAFATPMKFETLEGALTIKDGLSNPVQGKSYYLTDEAGNVIGVGFEPNMLLKGPASAILKGGANGVQAVDGRTMGGDYSWSFTLQPSELFLPLLSR